MHLFSHLTALSSLFTPSTQLGPLPFVLCPCYGLSGQPLSPPDPVRPSLTPQSPVWGGLVLEAWRA